MPMVIDLAVPPETPQYTDYSININKLNKFAVAILCFGTSFICAEYAAQFPFVQNSHQINLEKIIFFDASNDSVLTRILAIVCATSAFLVNWALHYKEMRLMQKKAHQDWLSFGARKDFKAFILAHALTLMATVPGSVLIGEIFAGAWAWLGRFLGFMTYFSFSYLGAHIWLHEFRTADECFYLEFIATLKRIPADYPMAEWWRGKVLNQDHLILFLDFLLSQAQIDSRLRVLRSTESFLKNKTWRDLDYLFAALVNIFSIFLIMQSEISGLNILLNGRISNLCSAEQLILGFILAFPLNIYFIHRSKFDQLFFLELYIPEEKSWQFLVKMFFLISIASTSATWILPVSQNYLDSSNFYPDFFGSDMVKILFLLCIYLNVFFGAVNRLTPMFLNVAIKRDLPGLRDIVKAVVHDLPKTSVLAFKQHGFFSDAIQGSRSGSEHEPNQDIDFIVNL